MEYKLSEKEMDSVCDTILNSIYRLREVCMTVYSLTDKFSQEQFVNIQSVLTDTAYNLAKLFIVEPVDEKEKIALLEKFSNFMYGIEDKSMLDKLIMDSIIKELPGKEV